MADEKNIMEKSASIASFDFGKVGTDPIYLSVDGARYIYNDATSKFERDILKDGTTITETLEGERYTTAIAKAFKGVKPPFTTQSFEKLSTMADSLHSTVSGSVDAVAAMRPVRDAQALRSEVLDFNKGYAACADEKAKKIFIEANKNRLLKGMIDADERMIPNSELVDLQKSLGRENWGAILESRNAAKAFANKIATFKFSSDWEKAPKELQTLIAQYHTSKHPVSGFKTLFPQALDDKLSEYGLGNIDSALDEFTTKATEAKNVFETAAKRRTQLVDQLSTIYDIEKGKPKGLFPDHDGIERLQKEIKLHDEQIAEFLADHPANGAAFKALPASMQRTLKSSTLVQSVAESATANLEKGAEGASKKKGGFFTYSEEKLAERVQKSGKTAEELGLEVGHLRKDNVALVAAGAVIAAVVACVTFGGKSDEKSYAKREDDRRAAAAQGAVAARA